jgi:hypothetical protein
MFYMQARWYDPGSGRFLSVDPLVRSAATPQSANPYSYAENNPVNGTDPTGQAYSKDCGGGCTEYYFDSKSYAASFGSDSVGSIDVTYSDGSTSTIDVTGESLSRVSEGGIGTLFANNGQPFGAVGDETFEAGYTSFHDYQNGNYPTATVQEIFGTSDVVAFSQHPYAIDPLTGEVDEILEDGPRTVVNEVEYTALGAAEVLVRGAILLLDLPGTWDDFLDQGLNGARVPALGRGNRINDRMADFMEFEILTPIVNRREQLETQRSMNR